MELLMITILVLVLMVAPLVTGYLASRTGRNFWTWFGISFLLPVVACLVLLLLPVKKKDPPPVENEELFNHLFVDTR